jgi:hypothetical protein
MNTYRVATSDKMITPFYGRGDRPNIKVDPGGEIEAESFLTS